MVAAQLNIFRTGGRCHLVTECRYVFISISGCKHFPSAVIRCAPQPLLSRSGWFWFHVAPTKGLSFTPKILMLVLFVVPLPSINCRTKWRAITVMTVEERERTAHDAESKESLWVIVEDLSYHLSLPGRFTCLPFGLIQIR